MKRRTCLGYAFGVLVFLSVNAPASAQFQTLEGQKGTIRGKVHDIGGSLVILEQPVTPQERDNLLRLGYRSIDKESEVGHQTVLGGRAFILLYFDRGFWSPTSLDGLKGQTVEAEVVYNEGGDPSVVAIAAKKN